MVQDWRKANENKKKQVITTDNVEQVVEKRWQPPEIRNFKVNVDASVIEGGESFSIGMVLRDHTGKFIEGKNMRFCSFLDTSV